MALLVTEHLVLIDTKQQFHIQTIDVLQQVLVHSVSRLAQSKYLEKRVFALELAPVSIAITRGLLGVEHLVLLVLEK